MRAGAAFSAAILLYLMLVPIPSSDAMSDSDAPALTNQDVVRMIASGVAEERILARIKESSGSYDLSADMIDELKLAGVPETILDAMKEKARNGASAAGTTSEKDLKKEPAPQAKGWIEIDFDDDPSLPAVENSIAAPAVMPDSRSKTPKNVELAFVVTCSHPVHVPDHWDSLSPLGVSIGRHQILFFQPATAQTLPKKKEKAFAYLRHPALWRLEAEAADHRGVVGVAARAGSEGPYILIAAAPYDELKVGEGLLTRVEVRLRAELSKMRGGRDPMRPMRSDPGQAIIGSTAALSGDLLNRISLKLNPPAPPPSPAADAQAPPPPP